MGGGLMQLVAYGAQDIYLTGNPQITFFKVVYRRHTNFSLEAIQQTFNGNVLVGGSTVTSTISRNGDLVSNLWLDVDLPTVTTSTDAGYINWANNTGHALIKECEIEIGGQRIDRHYSEWLDIKNELCDHDEKEWIGLNKHSGIISYLGSGPSGTSASPQKLKLYVPLKFWFCENPGLALPLIALQYHEVKIKLTTRGVKGLINTNGSFYEPTEAPKVQLWADYIYLDTDERRRFAQVSHEYLIEQIQKDSSSHSTIKKLKFNHPIKELIWVVQDNNRRSENNNIDTGSGSNAGTIDPTVGSVYLAPAENKNVRNDYFNYLNNNQGNVEFIGGQRSIEAFDTVKLKLNGHDRFAPRKASYFRTCQPIQAGHKVPTKHIYCYSFALKPEEHQPSGSCNFSRIDSAELNFKISTTPSATTLTVFAINYNVLRIMSGMGGLAYSN